MSQSRKVSVKVEILPKLSRHKNVLSLKITLLLLAYSINLGLEKKLELNNFIRQEHFVNTL